MTYAGGDPAESPKGKIKALLKLRAICPEKKQALQVERSSSQPEGPIYYNFRPSVMGRKAIT